MPSSHPTFHSPSPVSDADAWDSVLRPFPPCNYSLIWKNLSERKLTSVIYPIAPSKGAPTTVASCFQFCPSILHWGIAVCSLAHQPLGEYFHAHVVGHSLRRHAHSYNIEEDTILGLPLRMLSPQTNKVPSHVLLLIGLFLSSASVVHSGPDGVSVCSMALLGRCE